MLALGFSTSGDRTVRAASCHASASCHFRAVFVLMGVSSPAVFTTTQHAAPGGSRHSAHGNRPFRSAASCRRLKAERQHRKGRGQRAGSASHTDDVLRGHLQVHEAGAEQRGGDQQRSERRRWLRETPAGSSAPAVIRTVPEQQWPIGPDAVEPSARRARRARAAPAQTAPSRRQPVKVEACWTARTAMR